MYLFFALFIILLLFLILINYRCQKKNIQKVRAMSLNDKCKLLNSLIEPLGYYYVLPQDLFTTRINAWQRDFGYCALYDKAAPHFHMIFDSLPVYFNYQGKTWLLELWKGQYGINTGCEIGLYYANHILEPREYNNTLFQSVENTDMISMSFTLYRNHIDIARISGKHWWSTAFCMGCFSQSTALSLWASLTFPTTEMAIAFVEGLLNTGYSQQEISRHCNNVTFSFTDTSTNKGYLHRLRIYLTQSCNRFWCKMYLSITKPFSLSLDKLLYLYFYLPFAFRRILRIRRYKKYKPRRTHSV